MIPADHIIFDDDGTAWLVMVGVDAARYSEIGRQRPCDTCYGDRMVPIPCPDNRRGCLVAHLGPCLACDGTGRHTFTIEVACCHRSPHGPEQTRFCRDPSRPGCVWGDGPGAYDMRVHVVPGMVEEQEDGTWRVKLQIHQ